MEPILHFEIGNQRIRRTDAFWVVADSKNYLRAEFAFSDDWSGVAKTAIFGGCAGGCAGECYEVLLDNDACDVPWEWLKTAGRKYVSVYGGDRITSNRVEVVVHESGYTEGQTPLPPTPDVYAQLLERLGGKADSLEYDNNILRLLSGATELARVTIAGTGSGSESAREIELRNDGTYIQWRYVGEQEWSNLAALADLKGADGTAGKSAYQYAVDGGYTGT
ncbi:MAG: hypothetical protein ACI3YK_03065, partial [Eubacteriales bacterium]